MKKLCTCPKCRKPIDITDHNLIDAIPCMSCAEEFEPFEVADVRQEEEETQRLCYTCRKDNIRTGKDCPTRSGCFTPNYDNWEPIVEEDKDNPGWKTDHFTYSNTHDRFQFTLESESGGTILIELSPNEIADFVDNN